MLLGLTGGIGSGKTTVAKHLKSRGIPVYIADDEADLLMKSEEMCELIRNTFGSQYINKFYQIDKKKLGELVFNDPDKLKVLNALVHPRVASHFSEWKNKHAHHPIIVKEAAILFESGSYKDCDIVMTITAPKFLRINRVMSRDGISHAQVLKRMNNQWDENLKISKSNFVITNIKIIETVKNVDKAIDLLLNIYI